MQKYQFTWSWPYLVMLVFCHFSSERFERVKWSFNQWVWRICLLSITCSSDDTFIELQIRMFSSPLAKLRMKNSEINNRVMRWKSKVYSSQQSDQSSIRYWYPIRKFDLYMNDVSIYIHRANQIFNAVGKVKHCRTENSPSASSRKIPDFIVYSLNSFFLFERRSIISRVWEFCNSEIDKKMKKSSWRRENARDGEEETFRRIIASSLNIINSIAADMIFAFRLMHRTLSSLCQQRKKSC